MYNIDDIKQAMVNSGNFAKQDILWIGSALKKVTGEIATPKTRYSKQDVQDAIAELNKSPRHAADVLSNLKKNESVMKTIKELIESTSSPEKIVNQISEAPSRYDSKYFVRNAGMMIDDLDRDAQKFIQELIDQVEAYYPDGDISKLDLERLARDNEFKNQVDVSDVIDYVWDGMG